MHVGGSFQAFTLGSDQYQQAARQMPLQLAAVQARGAALLVRRRRTQRAGERHFHTRAYLTEHRADELQQTVARYCTAVNNRDLEALCSVLTPTVVWSDRVWCSSDLIGPRRVSFWHRARAACRPAAQAVLRPLLCPPTPVRCGIWAPHNMHLGGGAWEWGVEGYRAVMAPTRAPSPAPALPSLPMLPALPA